MGSGWWVVPILLSALRVSEARRVEYFARMVKIGFGVDFVVCFAFWYWVLGLVSTREELVW